MNAFPAGAGPPDLDWQRWGGVLERYAVATGVVVSVYDTDLQRRIDPLTPTRFAQRLANTSLWEKDGPGTRIERRLAQRCLTSGAHESDIYCTELTIFATPLRLGGAVRAVIIFGWVYNSFPTALSCDQLARDLDIASTSLWMDVRLETPVTPARMEVFGDLLDTLVESNVQQAEAIEELQALARMREVFLARVSHDLRTPLSALSLRIETLLLGELDDPQKIRQQLEGMKASVREEGRLIEDLIDAARTRTGQISVSRRPTELVPILRAALTAIQPQADRKGVRLHTTGLDTDSDTPIHADENRLQQVFWNLLSNAVKFMPGAGLVVTELKISDEVYRIKITDSGVGIDPGQLDRLFEPFVKREENNESGLGLGLSIVRHILDTHDGEVEAFSEGIGKGASFVVTLPRGAEDAAAV